MNKFYAFLILAMFVCCMLSCTSQQNTQVSAFADTTGSFKSLLLDEAAAADKPWLADYLNQIKTSLSNEIPVLLAKNLSETENKAQLIALKDPKFSQYLFNTDKKPYRNEIFNVYEARPGDKDKLKTAAGNKYFRVELYNFALDLTTIAIVNTTTEKVENVDLFPSTQPEIPKHLKDIALKIATTNKKVCAALGYKPSESDALMSNTKTALNNTKCERSMHLCVAPTFIKEDKALWAIVDLTDLKVVGIRWTQVNSTGPGVRISERKLKFDKIMECYCKRENELKRNGWELKYVITNSDGLKIYQVLFKNKLILHNAKLVDWHVSYSGTDGFGYSDAVGCPEFSQAAVVAVSEPKVAELLENGLPAGFVLEQSFQSEQWPRPCNYNYLQRFEFYNDGRFRISAGSLGRGCGNDGTYRPVFRIFFAGEKNSFAEWYTNGWMNWKNETWKLQNDATAYSPLGSQYRIEMDKGNFEIEPGHGQFADKGRGDNAWVFITRYHADIDEGEKDLVTIGPCCNTDYHQGPEKFIEPKPESIESTKFILWYVPQIKNDNTPGKEYCWAESKLKNGVFVTETYPCMAGPMFKPIYK